MPRGKGKVVARVHISLRVSEETLAYFKEHPNYTGLMRSVLEGYVEKQINKEVARGSNIPTPATELTWQELLAQESKDEGDSAI